MKLLIFGNPVYEPDSLALQVGTILSDEYETEHLGTPFDLLDRLDKEPAFLKGMVILDTAFGIPEPVLLKDLSKVKHVRFGSLHDFDMAFFLKMLESIGKVVPPPILAIPGEMAPGDAAQKARSLLAEFT